MQRGIDHLVVAVRDLDEAARFYRRLGFRLGALNRHPWGTQNRVIQFPGCFVELIAVGAGAAIAPHGARSFSFGAFVRDYLARREGVAMLALDSADARADAAAFSSAGIGDFEPFSFERSGRKADGSETRLAFSLAFARDERAPHAGFFVCQHHHPENFWNAAFQDHPNGAAGLDVVVLAADEPEAHAAFLRLFAGSEPHRPDGSDLSFPLRRGRIDVMTPDAAAVLYGSVEAAAGERPCFVSFTVRVADLDRATGEIEAAGIPFQRIGTRTVVPSSAAFGVAIAFEAA